MIDDLLKLGPNQEVGNQPLHARSIENHKSAVDWEPWLPCRSVHPFSQSRLKRPLSRSTIPTGLAIRAPCPRAPDHYVSRCSRSLSRSRDHVGHYRWPLSRSTPSWGSVGRYPDSVGRYPRTPSRWLRWGSVGHYPESDGRCPFLPRRLVIASTSPPDPGLSLLSLSVAVAVPVVFIDGRGEHSRTVIRNPGCCCCCCRRKEGRIGLFISGSLLVGCQIYKECYHQQ